MKKIILGTFATMFTFCSLQTNAQIKKGAYLGINVGYTAAAGAANVDVLNVANFSYTSTINEVERIKFSFGKGINTGLSFGYMFNQNIGAELGVQYLVGSKTKYTQVSPGFGIGGPAGVIKLNGDISAKMLQIKPTVVLATTIKKTSPYAKLGMVIGSGKITSNETTVFNPSFTTSETKELKGGISLGFTAAMGLNFSVILICLNNSDYISLSN
jgi:opacity protein-like surface antigen